VYGAVLSPEEAEIVGTGESIAEILGLAAASRAPATARKLRAYYLAEHAPDAIRQAHAAVVGLSQQRLQHVENFPTTMVMEEMPAPRQTFVLLRGEYDKHGEPVTSAIPESLPSLPAGAPNDRLGLARWVVDPANPLTARVAVNRYWQMHFGVGLVKTAEDFGSQGEWPTHPELLDWLATEFVASGWNVKGMQRLIVTSATYRQSSHVTPELWQRDPENRLLPRGPRFRLSAETIRDQALAASGLLVEKLGGPSVRPYQPEGLWKDLTGMEDYVQDHGESLYRRSLYTYWKRTVAPPAMVTFDAAGRETCIVRTSRTNTPLQALTLMNEVTFVEAARVLAQRVMTEGGPTPEERITLAFRLVLARRPSPAELEVLVNGWRAHWEQFQQDAQAAVGLLTVGESPRDEALDAAEHAAYAAICSLIFNLDETVTKE
jgi:hypothetical protein